MSSGDRRLSAIMFTDIVGYTALTQANERRAMELLQKHNELLRPMFARFHGKEVKAIGDSFLVEFDSALDALSCATEIQSELHEYNLSSPGDGQIHLRIGIHLGDVIHREGDVFGDAVNISSRIQPLAEPDGVCLSRQVYDQVRNKFDLPLVSMGEKELKNVGNPTEVFGVTMPWERPQSLPSAPTANRVAVLPFSNMSPDPADEFFADGMTEEIISTVSRIDGAEVISRTSVMLYKKSPKPIKQISNELEAGTVLEGSIRKAGNRLRVTVQMIDAVRDKHLWAESYDRNMDDVFAIQSDIAGRVAEALKAKMGRETPKEAGLTDNVDAYTDFLRAKQVVAETSRSKVGEAVTLLESAVAKDPKFSRAYSELARTLRHMGLYGDYTAVNTRGEAAARKAIETCPESAEAHAAMASICLAFDRFDEARSELQTAIRLNPNLAEAIHNLAEVEAAFGRPESALAYQRRAYSLDPVTLYSGMILAEFLRASGKIDEALSILARFRALYPDAPQVAQGTAGCYLYLNDLKKAREVMEAAMKKSPDPENQILMGYISALEGKTEEARETIKLLAKEGGAIGLNAKFYISTALGDLDEAFAALDELAVMHAWPAMIQVDPMLAPIVKDPRFADFRKKVGIQQ